MPKQKIRNKPLLRTGVALLSRYNRDLFRGLLYKWLKYTTKSIKRLTLDDLLSGSYRAVLHELFNNWLRTTAFNDKIKKMNIPLDVGITENFWKCFAGVKPSEILVMKPLAVMANANRACGSVLLCRQPSGIESWLDKFVATMTFRDVHLAIRDQFELPRPPTSQSVRVYFLSRHPLVSTAFFDLHRAREWKPMEIIDCTDKACFRDLRGTIIGVYVHKPIHWSLNGQE